MQITHYDEAKDEEVELSVEIDFYQPFVKGVYSGPWEDSYPDEPAEVEFSIKPVEYSFLEQDTDFMIRVLDMVDDLQDRD